MHLPGDFYFQPMQIQELYKLYLAATGITTDTRSIAEGNIFFALKGDKFNANLFAAEALNKGAAYVMVDEIANTAWQAQYGNRLILTDNVLTTLQQLAGYQRQQLTCPVLAITGSNGKTTTKELVAAVLSTKYKTHATKGNLNNHIGVPLTLLAIKPDVEFAVIEMGANHQGEIASYCLYTDPNYGLITNVGLAHIEGFGGFEGVVKGKTELYKYIAEHNGKIFLSTDGEILMQKANEFGLHTITYGKNNNADCAGSIINDTEFLTIQTEGVTIQTNLVGHYNFDNVMSAVCIGKYFGVEVVDIKKAIEAYTPTNNRSQKVKYAGAEIILDAYNANPSSMTEALKNFDKINADKKAVILGEMMELGTYAREQHDKIKDMVLSMPLQQKVFVGSGFSFLKDNNQVLWFENTELLKTWFKQQNWTGVHLLIKGSRKNELEKILKD